MRAGAEVLVRGRDARLTRPLDDDPTAERLAPHVIVTHMGALGGGKRLQHYDIERRVLLGALFRL